MSAPVVTQADREAAEAYWNSASDDWNPWSDISEEERALTVQAFARHRLATEAAFRAREAQLVEALQDLADALEDRGGLLAGLSIFPTLLVFALLLEVVA